MGQEPWVAGLSSTIDCCMFRECCPASFVQAAVHCNHWWPTGCLVQGTADLFKKTMSKDKPKASQPGNK